MKSDWQSLLLFVLIAVVMISGIIVRAQGSDTYTFASAFGSYGSGLGQLNNPYGMTVDSNGNIFVADTGNNRVEEFTSSGSLLSVITTANVNGNGAIVNPRGVAVDNNGNIFVTDTGFYTVATFNRNDVFQGYLGGFGYQPGTFYFPWGIAADNNGHIIVTDTYGGRAQEFTTGGSLISVLQGASYDDEPLAVTVDSKGIIYVSFQGPSGASVDKFTDSGTLISSTITSLSEIDGLAVDSQGNIFASDYSQNRIVEFDKNMNILTTFGNSGSPNELLSLPESVALDSQGNLFVDDRGNNRIVEFSPSVASVPELSTLALFSFGVTLAVLRLLRRRCQR